MLKYGNICLFRHKNWHMLTTSMCKNICLKHSLGLKRQWCQVFHLFWHLLALDFQGSQILIVEVFNFLLFSALYVLNFFILALDQKSNTLSQLFFIIKISKFFSNVDTLVWSKNIFSAQTLKMKTYGNTTIISTHIFFYLRVMYVFI